MSKSLVISVILIVALLITVKPVAALLRGFAPDKYPTTIDYGEGAYFSPTKLEIFEFPNTNSKMLDQISWEYGSYNIDSSSKSINDPKNTFIAFFPYKGIAILPVIEEGDGWLKIIYDQKNIKEGWIKLNTTLEKTEYNNFIGNFYSWYEFMLKIARNKGIYFVNGLTKDQKVLKVSPEDKSDNVKHDFIGIKNIELKHIRGNWMLIKLTDYDGSAPMGWVRWRDDEGKLLIFCNLD